jgi:methionine-gamma-lyase
MKEDSSMRKEWCIDTAIIHDAQFPDERTGAIAQSIVPAVAYAFPSV